MRSDVAQVTFRTTGGTVDSRNTVTVHFSIRAMTEELIKCTVTVTRDENLHAMVLVVGDIGYGLRPLRDARQVLAGHRRRTGPGHKLTRQFPQRGHIMRSPRAASGMLRARPDERLQAQLGLVAHLAVERVYSTWPPRQRASTRQPADKASSGSQGWRCGPIADTVRNNLRNSLLRGEKRK